ncbi:hypothetical protein F4703DRAFT_1829960 [Phycomyces blakesleeanus]
MKFQTILLLLLTYLFSLFVRVIKYNLNKIKSEAKTFFYFLLFCISWHVTNRKQV